MLPRLLFRRRLPEHPERRRLQNPVLASLDDEGAPFLRRDFAPADHMARAPGVKGWVREFHQFRGNIEGHRCGGLLRRKKSGSNASAEIGKSEQTSANQPPPGNDTIQ
jgi:hypothetical protein